MKYGSCREGGMKYGSCKEGGMKYSECIMGEDDGVGGRGYYGCSKISSVAFNIV